jgi:hypothetical protein
MLAGVLNGEKAGAVLVVAPAGAVAAVVANGPRPLRPNGWGRWSGAATLVRARSWGRCQAARESSGRAGTFVVPARSRPVGIRREEREDA